MKKVLNEENQIQKFISSFGTENVITFPVPT